MHSHTEKDEYEWELYMLDNLDNKFVITHLDDAYSDLLLCATPNSNESEFMKAYEKLFVRDHEDED